MKITNLPTSVLTGLVLTLGAGSAFAGTTALPSGLSLNPSTSSNRGFVVRVVQAPAETVVGNSFVRALNQLNGTLKDATGTLIPNDAILGPQAGGTYFVDTINFEKDGTAFDLTDADNNFLTTFSPNLFPGIPGNGGGTDAFAVEVVGFVELPAGLTTFGVTVGTDRTDVNDDDSYQVTVGANPRSFFGLKVGDFERFAPPFKGDSKNENVWTVNAPTAGLYPMRLVYWQTGKGASLQWYTVREDTSRVLLNDPAEPSAVRVFRDSTSVEANGPYVAAVAPSPGSDGNGSAEPITALIVDGASTVVPAGVAMTLNGAAVTPQSITKADGKTTVAYSPNAARTTANNSVALTYTDSAALARTANWSFGITVTGGSSTRVAGQWDFNSGDLRATVGTALAYFDPATEAGTKFGTTEALGVAKIGGESATIMEIPGDVTRQIGYVMTHGIAPNGGGTRVNQYTLIMDVLVDTSGPGAASLLQTSSLNNTDDGDLFWQGSNFGQGGGGYNGRGTFTAGEWHRVVAAYDMAATPPVVTKFVDGIKQDDWTANQSLDNTRRSLLATALLFADGDQDERRKMWVNSIQIRAGKISDSDAFVLGGPTAAGIPQVIPSSNVTGMWDFDYLDLGASIGKPLRFLDPTFDGPSGTADNKTTFGHTPDLAVADIGGQPASAMKVPGDLDRRIGYIMEHGIAPNGGGTRVNQYTLIMDVLVDTTGPGAASLLQTSSLNNTDDGDLFWQGSNFGQGGGGYNGRGTFTAGEWHRVVAAYDMAATPPVVVKYVDGIKQDDWTANQGLDNPRRALQPTALLFADGDLDERRTMIVNAIQVRSGRLTDAEIMLLGGPSAKGIPVVLPKTTVTGQWDFEFGDLGASVGSNLRYLDSAFDGPTGTSDDKTAFGTSAEFSLPQIGGQDVKVLRVPGTLSRQIGYVMEHRISPNGGGTRVNQYTLIMDLLVAPSGPGAASLLQTSSLNNTDDGDLFWQGNNFGQGGGGYNGTGAFTAGEWHRVVAAYDMAATPPVVVKYVDGIFQDNWTANQGLDNVRRALQPTALLFADGDQDERREMWASSIQIRAGRLSNAEIESLGGPSAAGIPLVVAAPVVVVSPELSVVRGAGTITVSWTGGGSLKLQSAPALTGPWTTVPGVTGTSATVPTATGDLYLRLGL